MNKFIRTVIVAGVSVGAAVAGPGGKGPGGNGGGNGGGKPSGGNSHPSFPSHGPSMSGNHWGMSGYKGSNFKGNYHLSYGKSFSHGYFYQGKNHHHWSFSCYWPKYGCSCYWCPSTSCYYYWCEPANCYYPVSYASYAPPTQVQVQVTTPVTVAAPVAPAPVQTQTQTQTQAQGIGGPPAGYPPLPQ